MFSCVRLCNPMDCSPPGSSFHGILQARILERVARPFCRGSSPPRIEPRSPALQADSLPSEPPGKSLSLILKIRELEVKFYPVPACSFQFSSVAQSCPTLCDPLNCSTPGLPVHHQLPEFTQTHVHRVGDAIQPSISSSVVPFSSCPQSFPASGSFQMSQPFRIK